MGIRGVPPGITDPNLRGFLQDIRNALAGLSDKVSKVTTTTTTISSGGGNNPSPGGNPPDGGGTPTTPTTPVDCSSNPAAPTSLTAYPASFSNTLVWTQPDNLTCYDVTEIWAMHNWAAWNSTYIYQPNSLVLYNGVVYRSTQIQNTNHAPSDTSWWAATSFAVDAKTKIGEISGASYVHTGLTPGETWAYWIRNRNKNNLFSGFFPADDVGVVVTTTLDPSAYLGLLTGSITETQLYKDLGTRISLIDSSSAIVGSVNARIKTAQDALQAGQDSLSLGIAQNSSAIVSVQNVNADQATQLTGLGTRTTASESQIATLNTTTATQATQISGLSTRTSTAESSITTINTTTANQASQISGLSTRTTNAESSITSLNTTTANQATQISGLSTTVSGNTSSISALNTTTANQATSLTNLSTRTSTTESNITNLQTTTTNQATSISQLSSTVGGHTTSIQQQSSSIDGLKAQYSVKIDSNGWISGFGLASTTQSDGTNISDFGIRADRFWLASPASPGDARGGPGIGLVDISGNGTGVVVRIASTVLPTTTGSFFTAYVAYVQLSDYPPNQGLNYINPFSGAATPQNRQWISLTNVRDSLSGNRSSFWNQAFPAQGVGNYSWTDYTYGYARTLSVDQFPGVTNANNVVVISSGVNYASSQGYTTNVTDPAQSNSDPAKLVPPKLLPFIVTTTAQSYNGVSIPAGVYMNNTYMVSAMMGRATMTGAIGSDNYVAGASGWQIDYTGAAEFNGAKFRGEVTSTVAGSPTFDSYGNVTSTGWAGWGIGRNGDAIFNTVVVRDGTQIGTNALVQAATVVDVAYANNQSVYTNTTNGTTDRFASDYTLKTAASKTAGFFFGLDLDIAANYTTKVVVTFSGAFNYVWIAYYKGGSVLSSRQLSATTTYNGTLTGQPLYTKVTATNNGAGGTWGDIKLSILEITG